MHSSLLDINSYTYFLTYFGIDALAKLKSTVAFTMKLFFELGFAPFIQRISSFWFQVTSGDAFPPPAHLLGEEANQR